MIDKKKAISKKKANKLLVFWLKLNKIDSPECGINVVTHYVQPEETDQDAYVSNVPGDLAKPLNVQ